MRKSLKKTATPANETHINSTYHHQSFIIVRIIIRMNVLTLKESNINGTVIFELISNSGSLVKGGVVCRYSIKTNNTPWVWIKYLVSYVKI